MCEWKEAPTLLCACMTKGGRVGSGCGQQWGELQGGNVSKWGEQDCGVSVSVYVCICVCMAPFMSSPGNV